MTAEPQSHIIFLSYTSKDATVAVALRSALERAGITCWMAPDDLVTGAGWAAEIPGAIKQSRALVLVASPNLAASEYVQPELMTARQNHVPIIPFQFTDEPLPEAFHFLTLDHQWPAPLSGTRDERIRAFVEEVKLALEGKRRPRRTVPTAASQKPRTNHRRRNVILLSGASLVLVAMLSAVLWSRYFRSEVPSPSISQAEKPRGPSGVTDSLGSSHKTGAPSAATLQPPLAHTSGPREAPVSQGAPPLLETGSLTLTSHPDGAEASVDGARVGITPCVAQSLRPGTHRFALQKPGYLNYTGSVNVVAGETAKASGELRPEVASLRVQVIPSGLIYIDKERRTEDSASPYETKLPVGRHEILAVSLNYGRWRKSIDLSATANQEIVFDFSKQYRVTVTSDPSNAKVYVNDVFSGKYTPSLLLLRPGQQKIDVLKDGFDRVGDPVDLCVEGDQPAVIHFTLKRPNGA